MADPFRERRFSGTEVRRILRRAAELAEKDPATAGAERPLTHDELERAAAELGIPASAVAAAMPASDTESEPIVEQGANAFIGAPTRFYFEEEFDGEPTDADMEDLLDEIRAEVGETGSTESIGKTVVFKLVPDMRGRGRGLSVRMRSRDGKTRIVVEEKLTQQAVGLFVGLGVGGGIGPMGGYIVAMIKLGLLGAIFPVLWIPLMLLLARTIFGAVAGRRERALKRLLGRIRKNAARWSKVKAPPPAQRIRVEAAKKATEASDEEAALQAEAEAEAEAAAAGRDARAGRS